MLHGLIQQDLVGAGDSGAALQIDGDHRLAVHHGLCQCLGRGIHRSVDVVRHEHGDILGRNKICLGDDAGIQRVDQRFLAKDRFSGIFGYGGILGYGGIFRYGGFCKLGRFGYFVIFCKGMQGQHAHQRNQQQKYRDTAFEFQHSSTSVSYNFLLYTITDNGFFVNFRQGRKKKKPDRKESFLSGLLF